MELTHASWFSGVGGLDLGLARAGWRTISVSEIDPYASAVLDERYGVPNLGDIVAVARAVADGDDPLGALGTATLWTGGFPCQDLSVAGKRRGFEGERSVLAFSFLDLVERYQPPAVLLENVPGLLSSHGGRDMAALLGRLGELGYGWAFRVLDARHFGVPQRRRRVFILGLRSDPDDADGRAAAERAAAVLSVGSRCDRHPTAGAETREGPPGEADGGADRIGSLSAAGIERNATQNVAAGHFIPTLDTSDGREGRDNPDRYVVEANGLAGQRAPGPGSQGSTLGRDQSGALRAAGAGYPLGAGTEASLVIGSSPDASRVRAPDGLAGRLDDRELVGTLRVGPAKIADGGPGDTVPIVVQALDAKRGGPDDNEAQAGHLVAFDFLNSGNSGGNNGGFRTEPGEYLVVYTKAGRAQSADDGETWTDGTVMPTLNAFDVGDVRTTAAIVTPISGDALGGEGFTATSSPDAEGRVRLRDPGLADSLLPLGLDSHRYRCCGNGVVAPVSEWIGRALAEELRG